LFRYAKFCRQQRPLGRATFTLERPDSTGFRKPQRSIRRSMRAAETQKTKPNAQHSSKCQHALDSLASTRLLTHDSAGLPVYVMRAYEERQRGGRLLFRNLPRGRSQGLAAASNGLCSIRPPRRHLAPIKIAAAGNFRHAPIVLPARMRKQGLWVGLCADIGIRALLPAPAGVRMWD